MTIPSTLPSLERAEWRSTATSLQEVVQEFESLFLAQLLKVMREAGRQEGLFGESTGSEIYQELMNRELARALARKGGVGLGEQLRRHLGPALPPEQGARVPETGSVLPDSFRVTSPFGWRSDPIHGEWRFHQGMDLAAPRGTTIPSLTAGRVVHAGWEGNYGRSVVVEDEGGLQIRYAHLQEVSVQVGQRVAPRQPIGKVGQTGRATGPHLHLEVRSQGLLKDPRGWIPPGGQKEVLD